MDIKELEVTEFGNMFPDILGDSNQGQQTQPQQTAKFGNDENIATDINLFDNNTNNNNTTQPSSTTDTTTVAQSTGETTTKAPEGDSDNPDILAETEGEKKAGRKPKYDFSDATGYFQDRVKAGKFVTLLEDVDGKEQEFIPKTPEEFDEFIDTQVNYQVEQKLKEKDSSWYQTKSPAWQAVARYAELVDDPADIVPFITGVQTLASVANIDEAEDAGAEQIVRIRMEQRGEPKDLIDEQVESLKTAGKLISTAQKYKPLILQQEQAQLQQMAREKDEQDKRYTQLVGEIKQGVIKAIETPVFGKHKLKQEEKAAVYDLIGEPAEGQGGYAIYTAIDDLFAKKDFETLREIALHLAKKDAFLSYVGNDSAQRTHVSLEKKIRVAAEGRTSGAGASGVEVDEQRPVIKRNQYSTTPRFGRG